MPLGLTLKKIIPVKITLTNFRSFANETFIFPQSCGLKLLTGENLVDKKLEANGAGKTSLWEGLVWCLYGYGIKGTRISDLVTWEQKQAKVVFELLISDAKNTITRYGPPNRLELNGKPTTQADIDTLIGLNYERFLHSVLFGQGEKLFPDLSVPDRANLFDSILDTSIWLRCIETASTKHKAYEKELNQKKEKLNYLQGKLSGLETEALVQKQIDEFEEDRKSQVEFLQEKSVRWDEDYKARLCELELSIEQWGKDINQQAERKLKQIEELENKLKPIQFEYDNFVDNALSGQISILQDQQHGLEVALSNLTKVDAKLLTKLEHIEADEQFWNRDACPSCGRKITKDEKEHWLASAEVKKQSIKSDLEKNQKSRQELQQQKNKIDLQIDDIKATTSAEQEKKRGLLREVNSLTCQIQTLEAEGQSLIEQLDKNQHPYITQHFRLLNEVNPYDVKEIKNKVNPHVAKLITVKAQRVDLTKQIADEEACCKELESQILCVEYWKHGFKRIRLFFIERVLEALQIEVRSSITSLGLLNWEVSFATESETKSGNTKLGVQIKVKCPKGEGPIELFSGGEAQRARLGIAKGIARLIQRSAGVWWNLECWDEPTNWLSGGGIEDLLQALEYTAESEKKPVWIIDHRSLQFTGFQEIWAVVKDSKGSKVMKLSESEA